MNSSNSNSESPLVNANIHFGRVEVSQLETQLPSADGSMASDEKNAGKDEVQHCVEKSHRNLEQHPSTTEEPVDARGYNSKTVDLCIQMNTLAAVNGMYSMLSSGRMTMTAIKKLV